MDFDASPFVAVTRVLAAPSGGCHGPFFLFPLLILFKFHFFKYIIRITHTPYRSPPSDFQREHGILQPLDNFITASVSHIRNSRTHSFIFIELGLIPGNIAPSVEIFRPVIVFFQGDCKAEDVGIVSSIAFTIRMILGIIRIYINVIGITTFINRWNFRLKNKSISILELTRESALLPTNTATAPNSCPSVFFLSIFCHFNFFLTLICIGRKFHFG